MLAGTIRLTKGGGMRMTELRDIDTSSLQPSGCLDTARLLGGEGLHLQESRLASGQTPVEHRNTPQMDLKTEPLEPTEETLVLAGTSMEDSGAAGAFSPCMGSCSCVRRVVLWNAKPAQNKPRRLRTRNS